MNVVRFLKIYLLNKKFDKGYGNLERAVKEFAQVKQKLIRYKAKHESTMREDWGCFPDDLDTAVESLEHAFKILYPHRPLRNLNDAMKMIEEIAACEKTAAERKELLKKLIRS